MDFNNGSGDKRKLQKPANNFGTKVEQGKLEFDNIKFCQLLGQKALPSLGIYGFEYQWLYNTGVFRREFKNFEDFTNVKKTLPQKVRDSLDDATEGHHISTLDQIHYYILNYNARQMKNAYLVDKNQSKVRINFAPHAYMWPNAKFDSEFKVNILSCIFTSHEGTFLHSSLRGAEECNDFGRITINPGRFFSKSNFQEVHLHPADNHNTAISPNNGCFLLNLTMPVVNFYIVMCTTNNKDANTFSIFNITIVNDESLKLNRELDTCLNTTKLLTHTPQRSQLREEEKKFRIPSMYLKVLEHSTQRIIKVIKGYFNHYLAKFEQAEDKEQLLKVMFTHLYAETKLENAIEPHIFTIGDNFLQLFYKSIWAKLRMPDIKNFGKRFFFEIAGKDIKYQLHLLISFMNVLCSEYNEIYQQHFAVLNKYLPNESDDTHMEDLAILESQLLHGPQKQEQVQEKSSLLDDVVESEESKVSKLKPPQIKLNDNDMEMDEIELNTDFLDSQPKEVAFPESQILQNHLESLFSGEKQHIVSSFNMLPELLRDYISFETWRNKGSIHGIHDQFGQQSYLQTNEIGEYYHIGDEDRVNYMLQLQETFANL